eukprot:1157719-Pelagomonas_calceolata.AAC.2
MQQSKAADAGRVSGIGKQMGSATAERIGAALDQLYGLLGEVLDGHEADLVVLSFEGQDVACVWCVT